MSGLAHPAFDPRVYLVTDAVLCGDLGVAATVRAAVEGGVTAVQVRVKDDSAAQALRLLLEVAEVCAGRVAVLMNDRVDVFLAARALGADVHGVHVGQQDLPVGVVRRLVGPGVVVGLSASTTAQVTEAAALPAGTVDYLGVGTVRPTRTKTDAPAALGVTGFGALCAASPVPCVAIGGIAPRDLAALRRAGGAGVAVVSAVCGVPDPRLAAAALRQEWDRA